MAEESSEKAPHSAEAAGRDRARYRRLFEECWAPIRTALESGLRKALLDTLGPLAKSLEEDQAKRVKLVLVRDGAFVQSYLEALQPELALSIRSFIDARPSGAVAAGSLSLIGHADSEFDAKIDQCAARLRNALDAEYGAVKLRLMNLLQDYELRDADSPFRLALFVRAVAGALRQIGLQESDVMTLVPMVSAGLGALVAEAYRQIDARLAAGGAGDTFQARAPSAARGPATGRGRPAGGSGSSDDRGGRNTVGSADPQTQSALLSLLERLQPAVQASGVPGQAPAGAVAASGEVASALQELKASGSGSPLDPNLLAAINQALQGAASATAAASGQPGAADTPAAADVRRNLIETASRKIDKLTIELVGLLFDRIQRDRHVPDAIKEQLARLQFPLLKLALGDPELFADSKQPARLLLDRIAATSIGWSPQGEDNQRYFDQVRSAIDTVLDSPGDPAGASAQALGQFARFLDEERARDDDPVVRARRALAEAENREILAIKATMQVRSAFDGVQLESYLREFLLDVWVRVLVDASLHEKTEPGLVRRYLDAIPELVWSVQPKINPGDRKRMIGAIPAVLGVLREGLIRIAWPPERVQQFFGRLMNSHANAVKALELAHGSLPQFAPSTVRIKLDGFRIPTDAPDVAADQLKVSDEAVRHALAASSAAVVHLSPPPEQDRGAAAMDHKQALQAVSGWSRGMWFDLHVNGRVERVALRWISPRRALYLFTSADGERAHSLTPEALVAYLQSAWLAPVEEAPLFDRAVDSMMFDLRLGTQTTVGAAPN